MALCRVDIAANTLAEAAIGRVFAHYCLRPCPLKEHSTVGLGELLLANIPELKRCMDLLFRRYNLCNLFMCPDQAVVIRS
jgi:hypothetical protein